MPERRAQDRAKRGPLAAFLILLGLLFGSASAGAAAPSGRDALGRPAPARHGAVLPGVRASDRDEPRDAASGPDGLSFFDPPAPRIVSAALAARPAAAPAAAPERGPSEAGAACYRARAPPAR